MRQIVAAVFSRHGERAGVASERDVTLLLCATKVTRRVVQRFEDRALVQYVERCYAVAINCGR
ncbi:hypothetical protein GRZ33_004316 [Salmonella enterica subsp. enterica]|nr:hypothetical protein [Salmonella enterica subsp. enterica serovar Kingston]